MLDVEELNEQDFALIRVRYSDLARSAREELKHGGNDTGKPEV